MENFDIVKLKAGFETALATKRNGATAGGGEAVKIEQGFKLSEGQAREREIQRLKKMIEKRRWNTDTNIQMVFPDLGLDLRPANINKIIGDAGFTPETEDAHEYMEEWDRLQAERLYEYLENQKKEKEGEGKVQRAAAESTSAARPDEPLAPAAETSGAKRRKETKGEEDKLNEKQEKIYQELLIKAKVQEMEEKLPKNEEGMAPDQKRDYKVKRVALIGMGKALKGIVKDFDEADIEYFRDGFMQQILDFYREEKKKTSNKAEFRELKNNFRKDIYDAAKVKGFDKYNDEQGRERGINYIVNYFSNLFNIEFILKNN